jgi:molybdate transport system substrate-binding protein
MPARGSASHVRATSRRAAPSRVTAALAVAALGASLVPAAASAHAKSARASGSVTVLYAGSLLDLMTQKIGPAFFKATGYRVTGVSAGSTALANQIKFGIEVGDVFVSASPDVNASLAGAANGNWVSSYRLFGRSPLVLGYNRASSFAHALTTRPWYDVVDRAGFLLGRTDPATDPKGVLALDALNGVALSYGVPQLSSLAASNANVYPETALVGRLQAGQLDAGFFYRVEAVAAHVPVVPLTGTRLGATYTIARLRGAPHPAPARAFISFLLSTAGRRLLSAGGISPISPARTLSATPSVTPTTVATTTTVP